MEKKKVIYIEVNEDEFKALKLVKNIANVSWRKMLIYAAMKIVDKIGGEKKFLEIAKEATELTKKVEGGEKNEDRNLEGRK